MAIIDVIALNAPKNCICKVAVDGTLFDIVREIAAAPLDNGTVPELELSAKYVDAAVPIFTHVSVPLATPVVEIIKETV